MATFCRRKQPLLTTNLTPLWIIDSATPKASQRYRVVSVWPTMDLVIAQSIPTELLCLLPTEWWWLLHHNEEEELGTAKVFVHPRAKIGALLVNAGISKEIAHGFTM